MVWSPHTQWRVGSGFFLSVIIHCPVCLGTSCPRDLKISPTLPMCPVHAAGHLSQCPHQQSSFLIDMRLLVDSKLQPAQSCNSLLCRAGSSLLWKSYFKAKRTPETLVLTRIIKVVATKVFQQEDDIIRTYVLRGWIPKIEGNAGQLLEGCCSTSEGETVKNCANSDRKNRQVETEKVGHRLETERIKPKTMPRFLAL